jgi:hypothetical protein
MLSQPAPSDCEGLQRPGQRACEQDKELLPWSITQLIVVPRVDGYALHVHGTLIIKYQLLKSIIV